MTTAVNLQNDLNKLEQRRAEVHADREQTANNLDQARTVLIAQGPVTKAINDVSALQARLAALDAAALSLDPQLDRLRAELAIEHARVLREKRASRLTEIAAARAAAIEDYFSAAKAASAALEREIDWMREAFALFAELGQEGRTLWLADNDRVPSDHIAVMADMPSREIEHGFAISTAYRTVEKKLSDAAMRKTTDEREASLAEQRKRFAEERQQQQEPTTKLVEWHSNRVQGFQ